VPPLPPSPGTSSQLCPLLLESQEGRPCAWSAAAPPLGESGPPFAAPPAVTSTVEAVRSNAPTGGKDGVPEDKPLLVRLPFRRGALPGCCAAPGAAALGEWWR
jgi:hypothetical protein